MNFEELEQIKKDKEKLDHLYRRLKHQFSTVESYRKDDSKSVYDLLRKALTGDSYIQELIQSVLTVESSLKHDFIRLVEMDLQAQMRKASTLARLKEQQIQQYLDD